MHPEVPTEIVLAQDGVRGVRRGAVVTVTLNRPESHNAMRPSTWAALAEVGSRIGEDVRVVVLRGEGPSFSSGLDRRLLAGETVGQDPPLTNLFAVTESEFDRIVTTYQAGFVWLRDPRFITIAAIQGHAIGAGFQLALACDLRVATEDAKFSMLEPALGLIPDLLGTKHLVEAVGYSRALEWTASARVVEAGEALAAGLVSTVVPPGALDEAIDSLADSLTAHPHGAVTAAKTLLLGASDREFEQQRVRERAAQFRRFAALAPTR